MKDKQAKQQRKDCKLKDIVLTKTGKGKIRKGTITGLNQPLENYNLGIKITWEDHTTTIENPFKEEFVILSKKSEIPKKVRTVLEEKYGCLIARKPGYSAAWTYRLVEAKTLAPVEIAIIEKSYADLRFQIDKNTPHFHEGKPGLDSSETTIQIGKRQVNKEDLEALGYWYNYL